MPRCVHGMRLIVVGLRQKIAPAQKKKRSVAIPTACVMSLAAIVIRVKIIRAPVTVRYFFLPRLIVNCLCPYFCPFVRSFALVLALIVSCASIVFAFAVILYVFDLRAFIRSCCCYKHFKAKDLHLIQY